MLIGAVTAANGFTLRHAPTKIAHSFADIGIGIGVALAIDFMVACHAWEWLRGRTGS